MNEDNPNVEFFDDNKKDPTSKGDSCGEINKTALIIVALILLVFFIVFLLYIIEFNKGKTKQATVKEQATVEKMENDNILSNTLNISFNNQSVKLLDFSGYEQEWTEKFLPRFSMYGNWIESPAVKDGKDITVLGLRNGKVREFDGITAVSPNFKKMAYVSGDNNELKVTIESIEDGKIEWESPIFKKVFSMYFGTETNLLNVIANQSNRTVWYVDGKKMADFDEIKDLASDNALMSEDKKKVAMAGTKDGNPVIIIDGNEKIFEGAISIKILGFSGDNKFAYLVKYSDTNNIAYIDGIEVARNIRGEGIRSGSVGLTFDNGKLIKQEDSDLGQFMRVFNEDPQVLRKSYYRVNFPSISLDGKNLAYMVDTMQHSQQGAKSFAVINEKEEKQYDTVGNIVWGGNNTYAYVAQEILRNGSSVTESNFVVVNGIEQKKFIGELGDVSDIESYKLAVNPVNGKVAYVVCNADLTVEKKPEIPGGGLNLDKITEIMHRCFVVYDGKSQPEFGLIVSKPIFTPDGEHILYSAGSKGDNFGRGGSEKLIIDGKKIEIGGSSWDEMYFSPDGKKIGLYVIKDKSFWWEVYDIEEILNKAEVLPNKDIENVQNDNEKDASRNERNIEIPEGWKKYGTKNFELYYPEDYKEKFENKMFTISSSDSTYEKIGGSMLLRNGIEISNNQTINYSSMYPQGLTSEKWYSEKYKNLNYAISQNQSSDAKITLSSTGNYAYKSIIKEENWTSRNGECIKKTVFLYDSAKYVELAISMQTCKNEDAGKQILDKILSTLKFI